VHDPRHSRILKSGRLGQGPGRSHRRPRRPRKRIAATGRHDCGGNRRQYRHWLGVEGPCAALSNRHSKDPSLAEKGCPRLYGAQLVEVEAVPDANLSNYIEYSQRRAAELDRQGPHRAIWANQFDNLADFQVHLETTGPALQAPKARSPRVTVALADPMGLSTFQPLHNRRPAIGAMIDCRGIGQGPISKSLEKAPGWFRVPNRRPRSAAHSLQFGQGRRACPWRLIRHQHCPRHTIGTGPDDRHLLCDSGRRYASRLFNADFLRG
jgi:cysteine synthase